jgi:catechol 2,3-dioxygenase-like lactoylglutathione lyase family enzyme
MPVIKVTGLNVLAIYVSDLEKAKEFYRDILGFEESGAMDPGFCMVSGDLTIYLEPGREECNKPPDKYAEVCPCFATEGLNEAYDKLCDAGVKIVAEYQEFSPEFAMFRIADPDGNKIEFAGAP